MFSRFIRKYSTKNNLENVLYELSLNRSKKINFNNEIRNILIQDEKIKQIKNIDQIKDEINEDFFDYIKYQKNIELKEMIKYYEEISRNSFKIE